MSMFLFYDLLLGCVEVAEEALTAVHHVHLSRNSPQLCAQHCSLHARHMLLTVSDANKSSF